MYLGAIFSIDADDRENVTSKGAKKLNEWNWNCLNGGAGEWWLTQYQMPNRNCFLLFDVAKFSAASRIHWAGWCVTEWWLNAVIHFVSRIFNSVKLKMGKREIAAKQIPPHEMNDALQQTDLEIIYFNSRKRKVNILFWNWNQFGNILRRARQRKQNEKSFCPALLSSSSLVQPIHYTIQTN